MHVRWVLVSLVCVTVAAAAACGGGSSKSATNTPAAGGGTPRSAASVATPAKPASQPSSKAPASACALLTASESESLGLAGEGRVVSGPNGPVKEVQCRWDSSGLDTLNLTVSELPPGPGAASVKASLQAEARDAGENGSEVSGIGDFAVWTSVIAPNGDVKAIVKGLLLDLEFSGTGARDKKDAIIALARAAAGRL